MKKEYPCSDCAYYNGDCGKHFEDGDGHIHYDCPSESMFDGIIGDCPKCWTPNKERIERRDNAIVEDIKKHKFSLVERAYNEMLKELEYKEVSDVKMYSKDGNLITTFNKANIYIEKE
jgi:hypothetical protein